jgi:hypothetical protein
LDIALSSADEIFRTVVGVNDSVTFPISADPLSIPVNATQDIKTRILATDSSLGYLELSMAKATPVVKYASMRNAAGMFIPYNFLFLSETTHDSVLSSIGTIVSATSTTVQSAMIDFLEDVKNSEHISAYIVNGIGLQVRVNISFHRNTIVYRIVL